jgi:hypothetical protein
VFVGPDGDSTAAPDGHEQNDERDRERDEQEEESRHENPLLYSVIDTNWRMPASPTCVKWL